MKKNTFLYCIIAGVIIVLITQIFNFLEWAFEKPTKEDYMEGLSERVANEFDIIINMEDITDVECYSQGIRDITLGFEAKMSNIDDTIYQKMSGITKDDNMLIELQRLDSDFYGTPASYIAGCIYNIWISDPDDVVVYNKWGECYDNIDDTRPLLEKQSFFAVDKEHSVCYYLLVTY